MHYIRFLKSPKNIKDSRGVHHLSAVITITTDLGDSFLYSDLPLLVELEDIYGNKLVNGGKAKEYLWKSSDGFKGLPIEIPIGIQTIRAGAEANIVVRAKEDLHMVESFGHALGYKPHCTEDEGGVVTLRGNTKRSGMVERVFKYGDGRKIEIWEEAGESIARHIWDAGLVLSAYLSFLINGVPTSRSLPQLPALQTILSKPDLNILELGAGCGIVGITLRQLLPNISQMILTDLPEATSILTHNISLCTPAPSHSVLDWSVPLPLPIASMRWNVILVADCTYNPDVVPDLIRTLGRLADGNKDLIVLLAMKVRHESEAVFFTLMKDGGWGIRESIKLPLPVLGGEDEEIEIFVFGMQM
ncbi:putative methyltransferase-domain-containing protein [Rhexocercosporidium sp. MPI-PUGE-AT-0058]|nr:putative methyltransferase-domain-containing protein [Rhexocercosporidium sp. MPI-PUGE-AT-0058]